MNERDRLNGIVECPCDRCRRRVAEAKEKKMKLPPEVKRAMDRLQVCVDMFHHDTDVSVTTEASRDLLSELKRYEKKLEESTKDIDVEHPLFSTHAMMKVRS